MSQNEATPEKRKCVITSNQARECAVKLLAIYEMEKYYPRLIITYLKRIQYDRKMQRKKNKGSTGDKKAYRWQEFIKQNWVRDQNKTFKENMHDIKEKYKAVLAAEASVALAAAAVLTPAPVDAVPAPAPVETTVSS